MQKQNALIMVTLLLIVFVAVVGQEKPKAKEQNYYRIKNPEIISLELLPRPLELSEDPKKLTEPYRVGDKIYFRLQATNTSIEPVTALITNPYYQNRPELLRDGQLVNYRKDVIEIIEAKDKDPTSSRNEAMSLEPNTPKIIGYVNLSDWYEQLEPGHYQLSVRHRFEFKQDWITSSSITFEVVEKKSTNMKRSTGGQR